MSLNPAAMAAVGIGYGPLLVAYAGLWPITEEPPVVAEIGAGGPDLMARAYVGRYPATINDDDEVIELLTMFLLTRR